jgi:hypothetical protein
VLFATFQILFCISSLGVSQELIFISNQMRKGGRWPLRLWEFVEICNEKISWFALLCAIHFPCAWLGFARSSFRLGFLYPCCSWWQTSPIACGYFRQQRYIYIFWRFSSRVVLVWFVHLQGFSITAMCEPCGWSIFASKLIVFLSHWSVLTGLSLPLLFRSGLTADRWLCLALSVRFSPQVFTAPFSSLS